MKDEDAKALTPMSIQIAVRAVQLDNIEVIPTQHPFPVNRRVWVFRLGNWENRLANASADVVNEDIRLALLRYKYAADRVPMGIAEKPKFYTYILGEPVKFPGFAIVKMRYYIK